MSTFSRGALRRALARQRRRMAGGLAWAGRGRARSGWRVGGRQAKAWAADGVGRSGWKGRVDGQVETRRGAMSGTEKRLLGWEIGLGVLRGVWSMQ
jgi:hypothetical protein